jgi:hypothetical protein
LCGAQRLEIVAHGAGAALVPLSSDLSVEPGGVAHALAPAFMQVLSEPFDVLVGRARPGVGLFRGAGCRNLRTVLLDNPKIAQISVWVLP